MLLESNGQDIGMSSHVSLHLANNIGMAIEACAPESSYLLRNREEMQTVLESLGEGYCHVQVTRNHKTKDVELELVGTCPLAT